MFWYVDLSEHSVCENISPSILEDFNSEIFQPNLPTVNFSSSVSNADNNHCNISYFVRLSVCDLYFCTIINIYVDI